LGFGSGPAGLRVGEIRSPWLFRSLIVLSVLVSAAVLYLTRYRTFFYDEWAFVVSRRPWQLDVFTLSHGGHWSTIPILIWKLLFITVGLRSHVPYEAALLVVHVVAVSLLFLLVQRRSGDLPAFAAALTLLVLGSGADEIVWAFQLAWVGSVAFGLLAMLLLEGKPPFPSRLVAVSAALLCSLMCSSVGVAFMAAVGAELFADRSRRRFLLGLVVPGAAFVGWFAAFDTGRFSGAPGISGSFLHGAKGWSYIVALADFVRTGLQAATAGVFGLTGLGALPLVALTALLAWHFYRRRAVTSWQVGLLAGVLFWFVLIGLGRVQLGIAQAAETRYVYVAAVFLLPVVADAASMLPWRGLTRPALTILVIFFLIGNVTQLVDQALSLGEFMRYETAELQTVDVFRGAPDMTTNRYVDNGILPQLLVKDYLAATNELGSPVPPATVATLRQLPPIAVDRVMLNLFGDALTVSSDNSRSVQGMSCQTVEAPTENTMDLQVTDEQTIMLRSSSNGDAALFLSFLNPPGREPLKLLPLQAGAQEWVHVPNTGKEITWQLRIQLRAAGTVRVCTPGGAQTNSPGSYRAEAETFTLGAGWSSVPDAAATDGKSAEASSGSRSLLGSGAFGKAFVPATGTYDLWYRVRVANPTSGSAEMVLAVTDVTTNTYMAAKTYSPHEATTTYSWLLVAAGVQPTAGHLMRFQTNIAGRLSTAWFVDEAAMVPAGSPIPTQ
jgi:hypothetical protein